MNDLIEEFDLEVKDKPKLKMALCNEIEKTRMKLTSCEDADINLENIIQNNDEVVRTLTR